MTPGPMAKHPSARQRRNQASTGREIVLSGEIRPVPELPEFRRTPHGKLAEWRLDEWHPEVKKSWAELWQYPLVYEAPAVDHHQLHVYIRLLQDFWERADAGQAINETARDLRMMGEQWGIGEKSRRHLQITIADAEKAMRRHVEGQEAPASVESASGYTPDWGPDDEDSEVVDATVVA